MDAEARAREAQIEVWQVHGALRAARGGGAICLPGVRLMSSGLPFPQWNSGDVAEPERVDVEAVRAWYAARAGGRGVPWGLRVLAGTHWPHGRLLFRKRLMALEPERFRPTHAPSGVQLRPATAADLDRIAVIDGSAFDCPAEQSRAWIEPQLGAAEFTTAIAREGGEDVGIATAVHTRGAAGPCCGIYGVAVLDSARRRGIGSALTSWLLARAFDRGATLAHLNPDRDEAALLYARLGFGEVGGFDIYADH